MSEPRLTAEREARLRECTQMFGGDWGYVEMFGEIDRLRAELAARDETIRKLRRACEFTMATWGGSPEDDNAALKEVRAALLTDPNPAKEG